MLEHFVLMLLASSPDNRKVDELTREFIAESQDGLQRMDLCLTELEKLGSDPDGRNKPTAMHLSAVERIERFPLSGVEYTDGRAILQYDGELIPLEDRDDVLLEMEEAGRARREDSGGASVSRTSGSRSRPEMHPAGLATVLICLSPGPQPRRVGIVVRRVLDISTASLLARDKRVSLDQSAMVKSSVTAAHPEFASQLNLPAPQILQEVA